ncbi:MAG: hypothetical protein KIT84_10670 [Labilithrix sp.]|nr:hypothetical protein [Labilithrix sp.]MCW5811469.1 hypothetical protein [Labilithrix sp.]
MRRTVLVLVMLVVAACAGANGDPAPAAVEAGTVDLVDCVDAGAIDQ